MEAREERIHIEREQLDIEGRIAWGREKRKVRERGREVSEKAYIERSNLERWSGRVESHAGEVRKVVRKRRDEKPQWRRGTGVDGELGRRLKERERGGRGEREVRGVGKRGRARRQRVEKVRSRRGSDLIMSGEGREEVEKGWVRQCGRKREEERPVVWMERAGESHVEGQLIEDKYGRGVGGKSREADISVGVGRGSREKRRERKERSSEKRRGKRRSEHGVRRGGGIWNREDGRVTRIGKCKRRRGTGEARLNGRAQRGTVSVRQHRTNPQVIG